MLEGRLAQNSRNPSNRQLSLRKCAYDVSCFMTDHGAPFSNNLAQEAMRMPKPKQKIPGSFICFCPAELVLVRLGVLRPDEAGSK